MTPVAIGRAIRALRHRRRWRQLDLATHVGIDQGAVSHVESGHLGFVSVRTLAKLVEALGGELAIDVRWRGGDLDRLMDRAHADLVERVAQRLRRAGWEVFVEVSFAEYAERGSIDVMAWHRGARIILVVEVKSAITAVEETLRRHDAKVRLAPKIAFSRLGERPATVARLLVLPDTSTSRRRLEAYATTFDTSYPMRGRAVTRWLASPSGPMAGVMLVTPGPTASRPRRIRRVTDG